MGVWIERKEVIMFPFEPVVVQLDDSLRFLKQKKALLPQRLFKMSFLIPLTYLLSATCQDQQKLL